MEPLPAYVIVSPVKDEVQNLARTVAAVVAQQHRPARWVIVDDGSTDGSRELAQELAAPHDWIEVVDSGRSGERARGGPIVRAFRTGLERVAGVPHDVVVKLDGDVHVGAHYFAWVTGVFAREPRAGIVGGLVFVHDGSEWVPDKVSRHSVNGVAKAYRVRALEEMGGLAESMGWDGIDEYAARARGWSSHVLTEAPVLHYKPRGSKQTWQRARWEEGVGAHYMGYRVPLLLLRVLYRMVREHPPVLGGLLLGLGFGWARITDRPQYGDRLAIAQLRREQSERIRNLARGRFARDPDPLEQGGPAFWFAGR